MNSKRLAIAGTLLVVGWLSLGSFAGRPADAPPAAVPATAGGRYQMVVSPSQSNNDAVYVIDTQTGQVWWRQHVEKTQWNDWGSPAVPARK